MKNFVINKYLVFEFLKSLMNVILVFACLGLIMNLFEEINYFKNYGVGIGLPISLSFMIIPSIIINMFPFILFLSAMWVFIKLKNNRDLLALKTFGYSNLDFLILYSISAFFIGTIILVAFNPVTSIIVKYYEDIKGKYSLDKSHLATITGNGIYIKEKVDGNVHIIRAKELGGDFLYDVTIYKFDKKDYLSERIQAEQVDVSSTPWVLQDVYKSSFNEKNPIERVNTLNFNSSFNKEKLNTIYSNLDTVSFYKLITEKNDLIKKGYNPKLLEEKKQAYLSLPFFLILMVILAGIFTLNSNDKRQNAYYVLLSIIVCVIIYYFKNFSAALGSTERIPIIISVWSPVLILFIFCSVGIIQINEK